MPEPELPEYDAGLLAIATKFSVGRFGDPYASPHDTIDVEAHPGIAPDGAPVMRWGIICAGWAYTKAGKWVQEPIPSYRTEKYLAQARWYVRDEAINVARMLMAEGHPQTEKFRRRSVR